MANIHVSLDELILDDEDRPPIRRSSSPSTRPVTMTAYSSGSDEDHPPRRSPSPSSELGPKKKKSNNRFRRRSLSPSSLSQTPRSPLPGTAATSSSSSSSFSTPTRSLEDGRSPSSSPTPSRRSSLNKPPLSPRPPLRTDQFPAEITSEMAKQPVYLQHSWTFWYDQKQGRSAKHNQPIATEKYERQQKKIGSFATIQGFWGYWNNIDLGNLPTGTNVRLFKRGIKPIWEDPANASGGKWSFFCPKSQTSQWWTLLVLTLLAEEWDSDELCGTVLSIRASCDILSLWNTEIPSAEDQEEVSKQIRNLLSIPQSIAIGYTQHSEAIDKSVVPSPQRRHRRRRSSGGRSPSPSSAAAASSSLSSSSLSSSSLVTPPTSRRRRSTPNSDPNQIFPNSPRHRKSTSLTSSSTSTFFAVDSSYSFGTSTSGPLNSSDSSPLFSLNPSTSSDSISSTSDVSSVEREDSFFEQSTFRSTSMPTSSFPLFLSGHSPSPTANSPNVSPSDSSPLDIFNTASHPLSPSSSSSSSSPSPSSLTPNHTSLLSPTPRFLSPPSHSPSSSPSLSPTPSPSLSISNNPSPSASPSPSPSPTSSSSSHSSSSSTSSSSSPSPSPSPSTLLPSSFSSSSPAPPPMASSFSEKTGLRTLSSSTDRKRRKQPTDLPPLIRNDGRKRPTQGNETPKKQRNKHHTPPPAPTMRTKFFSSHHFIVVVVVSLFLLLGLGAFISSRASLS